MTDEEILTMHQLCLGFPDEEEEDFDDCVHRMASACLMWATDSSPWGSACTRPRRALCRACKHVICRAWELNLIHKEVSLSLEKLTQKKKRGHPKKLKGRHAFDEQIVFELEFVKC